MSIRDSVAIVGYAARLPASPSAASFWSLLHENRSAITRIGPDRFPTEPFFHPSTDQKGRSYSFKAGVIDDVWGFDAGAFGMSPREAEQVDPQQRHLLEVTFDALAHAGIRASSLAGSRTGVYVGASSLDYGARFFSDPAAVDVHMMTGNTLSVISNRISYVLNAKGPSFTVDTACSSSLVALSLATDAIREGTVDTAIVGGVNLLLSPFSFVGFSRASMLSPTGLCRPFDAAADGYVRSEGAIVLILRSVPVARKRGNQIYATILGSGIGQDGRTTGLSLPSAASQHELLERVYDEAGIDPADLTFVEAHGTGTRVGDPIEAEAIGKALAQRRTQQLPIGSVKSNVGHLEPASGLAGVLKTVLAINNGVLPATLHHASPNPDIPFDELNIRVVDRNWRLPQGGACLAGVNSFGFGGTNAHVILRGDDANLHTIHSRTSSTFAPLVVSAHSSDNLRAVAKSYVDTFPSGARHARDFVAAAAHLRDVLPHRAVLLGGSQEALHANLTNFVNGQTSPSTVLGQAVGHDLPVAFLFAGNGSQWAGMGRAAWHTSARFRDALENVDRRLRKRWSESAVELLFADDLAPKLRQARVAQPLLLALQVATVQALEATGLVANAVLGHSVGEVAAAWCAGALTLDQAIDVVIARSQHFEDARGKGAMAALMLGEREVRHFLSSNGLGDLDIAGINSWRSVTVSGATHLIDKLVRTASEARIGARRLDLDYPYHSALVDSARGPLQRELSNLKSHAPRTRLISSTFGAPVGDENLGAEHWWRNMRDPVRFEAGLNCLIREGLQVFVEIGPKPIMMSYVRDALREAGVRGVFVDSLTDSQVASADDAIERCAARAYVAGGRVELHRLFGSAPALSVPLPAYPWRHAQYSVAPTIEAATTFVRPKHPLIGQRLKLDSLEWFSTIDTQIHPWLKDHAVDGVPVFPAVGFVEAVLAVGAEIYADAPIELRDFDIVRPLVFDGASSFETLIRFNRETGLIDFLSRQRSGGTDWILNARGIVTRCPVAEHPPAETEAGSVIVLKDEVYRASASLGFQYGPMFQRIRRVSFPHPKRSIGIFEDQAPAFPGAMTDLIALDAAFHCLFAAEEAGVADMPMKQMVPVRFDRVRLHSASTMAAKVVAHTLRQSPTSMLIDIELLDASDRVILSAERVRLVEIPAAKEVDSNSLVYRTTAYFLDRAGMPSHLVAEATPAIDASHEADAIGEALMLLEAGCLRQAWAAFRSFDPAATAIAETEGDWHGYLTSALLWHLETRELAREENGSLSLVEDCNLPTVPSVVQSLLARHSTMASEAAGLARLSEIIDRLVAGDATVAADLRSAHWRQLDVVSEQISLLRRLIHRQIERVLNARAPDRFLRVLMVGAHHSVIVAQHFERLSGVEFFITDIDADRLEHARSTLGNDSTRIHCVSWEELDGFPAGSFDIAAAIDALSEIAASQDGLQRLRRALRPNAPLIAGEPAPSLFWDLIRGIRPSWWARSANAEFPVGALLTSREWSDELALAGFAKISVTPVLEDETIGMVLNAAAVEERHDLEGEREGHWTWHGTQSPKTRQLQAFMDRRSGEREHLGKRTAGGVIWQVDATTEFNADHLATHLDGIADCARHHSPPANAIVVLVDFGDGQRHHCACLQEPIWTALAAALRVMQNEFPQLSIRHVGIAGSQSASNFFELIANEICSPDDEREVLYWNGERLVFRVQRGLLAETQIVPSTETEALQLMARSAATHGSLLWRSRPKMAPAAGEVGIEVRATGLNFRDVMWNLGLLPEEALEEGYAGASLGMECSGVVSEVGEGVSNLTVGDNVVAFVEAGFATHVTAPVFAVRRIPHGMSFEVAASVPVAFLTAYYSLVRLAQIRQNEIVLIHGGAGAVGLAALQVARARGARVIATAGTEEKRALLRDLGAEKVLNSRTLSFADDVMAHTNGKGVDIVLNSLAGEAMIRSMDCLRPFGRFIELGKRDFYANTHVGLRPFRKNLSYHGVDVDQLIDDHSDLIEEMFDEILDYFRSGDLKPLPYCLFSGEHVAEAFRFMQRSSHIGKIVVSPAKVATLPRSAMGKFPVSPDGWHVVVGGTSGFGFATAEWLIERGAKHVVLASRSASPGEALQTRIDEFRRDGIEIGVMVLDVGDASACRRVFADLAGIRPIRGIVHAAMVLDDRLIQNMDREAIQKVLIPKVSGALNLEALAGTLAVDYLLLFSSATTFLGNPGQYNYVAANGFVEGLARRAQARGLPVLAVAWGGIEDAGYLARNISANTSLRHRFASSLLSARSALNALDLAFDPYGRVSADVLGIAKIDWPMARRELALARSPLLSAVAPGRGGMRQTADTAETLQKLKDMSLDDATAALIEMLSEEIARVLRLPIREVDTHRPLAEIGMDSLMMLELRATVETTLQIELPMMSLANGTTPADIARRIASVLLNPGQPSTERYGRLIALSGSHVGSEMTSVTDEEHQAAARAVIEQSKKIEGSL